MSADERKEKELPTKICPRCDGKGEVFDPSAPLPRIENRDGTISHIVADGSRYHVVAYFTNGMRCSEPNCEINQGGTNRDRREV